MQETFKINGVLVVNKPKGYTSHDIVNILRKKLNTRKIGHAGTLDPNATGVLPILVGTGTKVSKYLIEHKKTYIATIKLGERTNTGDAEGKVIENDNRELYFSKQEIEKVLKSFVGEQTQIPPIYSAIKIKGKKAYEYAREGKEIELTPRKIEIYSIKLLDQKEDRLVIEVSCSKGTYIRTLCEDIGENLGTFAYMEELQRTEVDKFNIEQAIDIMDLDKKDIENKIITIEEVFKNSKKIELSKQKTELFLNGVKLTVKMPDNIYRIYCEDTFIGLGIIFNELLKRDVIIIDKII